MDAAMHSLVSRPWALLILLTVGCHSTNGKRLPDPAPVPSAARGTPSVPSKPLAINDRPISPARQRDMIEDRELLIPPPPKLAELTRPPMMTEAEQPIALVSNNEPIVEPSPRVEKDEVLATMKRLQQTAAAAYARLDAFEARLTRRETIDGKAVPQEVIRFQFRQQPYSVHLTWIGGEPKTMGREVLYVHGYNGGKVHIKPTKDDSFPIPPRPMSFAPDSSTIRSKSRHDIREAGLGEGIRHLGEMFTAMGKNPSLRTRFRYLGAIQRPEFAAKLEAIEETVPPRTETLLPNGAKRTYYFDTSRDGVSAGLPVIVMTFENSGKEVEYYCFDRFQFPVSFTDAEFNPEKAWPRK
jgi:Protein of unknown function (DUF1571)